MPAAIVSGIVNEFYLHENEKSFLYQRLSTFDTDTRGNSEVAYFCIFV